MFISTLEPFFLRYNEISSLHIQVVDKLYIISDVSTQIINVMQRSTKRNCMHMHDITAIFNQCCELNRLDGY